MALSLLLRVVDIWEDRTEDRWDKRASPWVQTSQRLTFLKGKACDERCTHRHMHVLLMQQACSGSCIPSCSMLWALVVCTSYLLCLPRASQTILNL